jgi:hypothetical protein
MKHAVEIGICAMIDMPSFIKFGLGIETLMVGDTQTAS